MQSICLNPSCSNVETFDDMRCPLCHDVVTVDAGSIVKACADRDSATELITLMHLDVDEDALELFM